MIAASNTSMGARAVMVEAISEWRGKQQRVVSHTETDISHNQRNREDEASERPFSAA